MRVVKTLVAALALSVLAACAATGPKHSEIAATIPPVSASKGRIYFFRPDTIVGAAITSDINLNGRVVGKSERGGFFFVDETPGSCTVATSTEVEKRLTFVLQPGETKYVKTSVSLGVLAGRINPELVSADNGKAEISTLSYTGTPLTKK